ncbi:hypothetical protein, partial [Corynebacterium bovis]|uniref:hypothetical protein n=1 Tax=Corynebacterium bovis TaxID=36808 RepID=UPI0011CF6CC5
MTLRLTGVRVLVPDGPGAAVAAELMREAGAEPVVVGFDAVPPAGHPFLDQLMAHREYQKMKSTVDGLVEACGDDGRIHTTFNQTA